MSASGTRPGSRPSEKGGRGTRRARLAIVCLSVLASLLPAAIVWAQPLSPADAKKSEERAMAVVKRMADFLARLPRFSVSVDIAFDVVQAKGQKLEFGETRQILLRRPDRLRIDETRRDGRTGGLVFDGKTLTVFSAKDNVYATDARIDGRGSSVDELIAHILNDLEVRLPMAEWLDSNLPKMLSEHVREAAYVEQSQIAGVSCDHLALRGDEVDLQVWVAQGDKPLPQRLLTTYTREDGRPQFRAQLRDWNLSPAAPDSRFTFTPPAGAVKITFAPKMIQPGGLGGRGGQ